MAPLVFNPDLQHRLGNSVSTYIQSGSLVVRISAASKQDLEVGVNLYHRRKTL